MHLFFSVLGCGMMWQFSYSQCDYSAMIYYNLAFYCWHIYSRHGDTLGGGKGSKSHGHPLLHNELEDSFSKQTKYAVRYLGSPTIMTALE